MSPGAAVPRARSRQGRSCGEILCYAKTIIIVVARARAEMV